MGCHVMKTHLLGLLLLFMLDGGVGPPLHRPEHPDGGSLDGGTVAAPLRLPMPDAGTATPPARGPASIQWPEELQPLATLDGPAILAAHAALQRVLERLPKEQKGTCAFSAKAMEVLVGQQGGLYFVRINQRLDRCGRAPPGLNASFDWFELYAVSPEGQILERYPYHP